MSRRVRYIRCSTAALETLNNPAVNHFYMSEEQLSNPRKRQRTEQNPLPSPPSSKRQKLQHHEHVEPPEFWDSLSKVWLTKRALRELNRRSTVLRSSRFQARRPITRNFRAKQHKNAHKHISAAGFLRRCSPRRSKDVERFARRGGPDLSDLIGYSEPTHSPNCMMSSSRASSSRKRISSSSSSKTKTTAKTTSGKTKSGVTTYSAKSSPYDANFEQNHIDVGVYQYGYKYPDGSRPPLAGDYEAVNRRLAQYRPSLSPSRFSDGGRQDFVDKDAEARREQNVKTKVLPALLNAIGASEGAEDDVPFTHIAPFADNNTKAVPDYYYGAQPEQLDPTVRGALSSHIVPQPTYLIAPNFFLEAKGPSGSTVVALRQACHDGAIGARAMHSLQTYGQDEPDYDNNISAISTTYHAGVLKMYGHSAAQPNGPGTRPEYYMHQLDSWSMTGNKNTFLQGATAFKNAIDLTKEYRNTAITHANETAAQMAAQTNDDEEDEEEEQEEEGENNEDKEDEEVYDRSSSTMPSFAQKDEDEDDSQDERETSVEEEYKGPPQKRSKRQKSKSSEPKSRKPRSKYTCNGSSQYIAYTVG
ncbi:hypothetical protein ACMFMG_010006 [Clarireedia jacksonii]